MSEAEINKLKAGETEKELLTFDEAGEVELSASEKKQYLLPEQKVAEETVAPEPQKETKEEVKQETKEETKKKEEVKVEEPVKPSIETLLKEKLTKRENADKLKAEQDGIQKLNAEKEATMTLEEKALRQDALTLKDARVQELELKLAGLEEAQIYTEFEKSISAEEWAILYPEIEAFINSDKYLALHKAKYSADERAAQAIATARGLSLDKIVELREKQIKAKIEGKEQLENLTDFGDGKTGKSKQVSRLQQLEHKALNTADGLTPDEIEEMFKLQGL